MSCRAVAPAGGVGNGAEARTADTASRSSAAFPDERATLA